MEDHAGHPSLLHAGHHLQPPSLAYGWDPQLAPFDGHVAGGGGDQQLGCGFTTASELRQALLRALAELDAARAAHQAELRRMESEAARLASLVASAAAERDELRRHCHSLLLLLHHQSQSPAPQPPQSLPAAAHVPTTISHAGILAGGGGGCATAALDDLAMDAADEAELEMALARRLPEKGRLVEAVVSAGPLLQTLLLAGPLPRWRHPPPAAPTDIPPFNPGRPSPTKGADADASASNNNSVSSASATSSSPESNCSGGGGYAPLLAPALPYHMSPYCM